jgi:hypothetical protein
MSHFENKAGKDFTLKILSCNARLNTRSTSMTNHGILKNMKNNPIFSWFIIYNFYDNWVLIFRMQLLTTFCVCIIGAPSLTQKAKIVASSTF